MRKIAKSFLLKMRKIAKCLICKLEKERNVYILSTWRDGYQSLPACCVFRKKFFRAESCAEEILFLCMEFILFANKKGRYLRTTLNVYTTE